MAKNVTNFKMGVPQQKQPPLFFINLHEKIKCYFPTQLICAKLQSALHHSLQTTSCYLNITILDVNDNNPQFQQEKYHFVVTEEQPSGVVVGKVHVRLLDCMISIVKEILINKQFTKDNHIFLEYLLCFEINCLQFFSLFYTNCTFVRF